MTEGQEKMLFDFLESLGFTSSELKERIHTKIQLGIARFSETETIFFGENRMHYQLNFARDPQFQGYRLTGYDAIYRQPILIEHGTVNGINTEELEQQMQGINWSTISVSTLNRLENEKAWNREAETIQDVVSRVWRLSDNENAQGKQIQDRLRLKYWLDTPFDSPSELQMLRGAYEVRRTFPVSEYGSCPANLAGPFGFDKICNTTSKRIANKRTNFTKAYATRLETVQIECADALYVIQSRDHEGAFFYCDPPYVNSNCGHYKGYTEADYEALLRLLSGIKGKFLLSSYPSALLDRYCKKYRWHSLRKEMLVTVNAKSGKARPKTEVLTANYPIVPSKGFE